MSGTGVCNNEVAPFTLLALGNLGSDLESIFDSVSKFWNEGADTGSSEF